MILIIRPKDAESCKDYSFLVNDTFIFEYDLTSLYIENEDVFWNSKFQELADTLDISSVIIDRCNGINETLKIIGHLRLTSDWGTNNIPIIWVSTEDFIKYIPSFIKIKVSPRNNLHFVNEFDYVNFNAKIESLLKKEGEESFLSEITIIPPNTSHQVTNEWGAYILAKIAGFEEVATEISKIKQKYTDLYFKYLQNIYLVNIQQQPLAFSEVNELGKFILIDDNHDKGWSILLRKLLTENFQSTSLETLEDEIIYSTKGEASWNIIKDKIEGLKPHVIFLDLRLLKEEDDEKYHHISIEEFSGAEILKKIKKEFPDVSVIIFTASNKAWNMQKLLDLGADGYFIKPSPEIQSNANVLGEELKAFVKLIKDVRKKHLKLSVFWQHIQHIKKHSTLINERGNSKVEERIRERLMMFFGLLKRESEDSKYNKELFFYSDIELAFMTLWSCLNDIQYIYYDKNQKSTSNTGNPQFEIKIVDSLKQTINYNHPLEINLQTIEIVNNKAKFETKLKADYKLPSNIYSIMPNDNTKKGMNYQGSIGEQIAFLLFALSKGTTKNQTGTIISVNSLTDIIAKLKNKRNHIYLTHGIETDAFFSQTEKEKRDIELNDCTELFEIVYFLLTAEYIKISTA